MHPMCPTLLSPIFPALQLIVLLGSLLISSCGPGALQTSDSEDSASSEQSGIGKLTLTQLNGEPFETEQLQTDSATVIFILSPECPLCHDYAYTFRTMQEEFSAQGIRFVGVFPGEFFSASQIRMYCSRYMLNFPMLLDPGYKLIHQLGANTTPEAILLNKKGQTIYQGSIDNWAYEVGQKRLEPTEHYLRDALQAFQQGSPVPLTRTKAVGCLIE